MENTGRIRHGLTPSARRMLFGETAEHSIDVELRFITEIDRAHLVMLVETCLVKREQACRLLRLIEELRSCRYEPLRNRIAVRGLYLLYEDYLIEQLGAETGGVLHTGRSRNDLNATVLRLRLREPFARLLREGLRLQAALLKGARRYADVVMPVYTHYQAALPITYGHYLLGVACQLERDMAELTTLFSDLNYCPLGAGAAGGTTLTINPARTAALLGFGQPVRHSLDAVASRDFILRLLSNASMLGVTLSRCAADLLLWTTTEIGFISLPDRLVGSSSMMPQKRNPFLLEHIQGRSAAALGALVQSTTAMHAKPFTNSISVGTEGVAPVWAALQSILEAALLTRLVVSGARPNREAMLRRAEDGFTTATELANRLMTVAGMPYRKAHHIAGTIVRAAIEQGQPSLKEAAAQSHPELNLSALFEELNPARVAQASSFGGGPGVASFDECFAAVRAGWANQAQRKREEMEKWSAAQAALNTEVTRLCVSPAGEG